MGERRDAARNRAAILAAATRLIGERGLDAVNMEDVAVAAGVGKGTVFRRFGDREGLIQAVVAESAEAWKAESEVLVTATDRPPDERVITFVATLFDHVMAHLPVVRALEQVSARGSGCDADFDLTHSRLSALIAQVRPYEDAEFLAHALLANLRGEHLHHLVHRVGLPVGQVRLGVIALARAVLTGDLVGAGRDATMPPL